MRERPLRFLVIDDEPRAAITGEMLRDLGHAVVIESRGATGLARAHELRPDVVLLEIPLPDISGFELARQLREAYGGSVVLIATTAWAVRGDRERAREAGFDFYVAKPTSPLRLQMLVDEAGSSASALPN
jgi:CheY-like chemotaxis protein